MESPADWGFLLDGSADGYVELNHVMSWDYPHISNPSGYLSKASLIINATPVPEPTGLMLLGLGVAMLLRRR